MLQFIYLLFKIYSLTCEEFKNELELGKKAFKPLEGTNCNLTDNNYLSCLLFKDKRTSNEIKILDQFYNLNCDLYKISEYFSIFNLNQNFTENNFELLNKNNITFNFN